MDRSVTCCDCDQPVGVACVVLFDERVWCSACVAAAFKITSPVTVKQAKVHRKVEPKEDV